MIEKSDHLLPFVTIILPVRNEGKTIEKTLKALFLQEYPSDRFEVVVADGNSNDDTREILIKIQEYENRLKVIDNPKGIVSSGLNLAIQHSIGEIIIRIDGHTEVATDYIKQCIAALEKSGADNVGGKMTAIGTSRVGKAIAIATSTPFGIGGSRFHYSNKEEKVDTVYLGAWKRSIFDRIGLFDEDLVRNQDDEWNYRLRERGGKIFLSQKIKSKYEVRNSLWALAKQYFQYGFWKIRVMQKHPRQMRISHYIPAIFLSILSFSLVEHSVMPILKTFLILILTAYVATNLAVSLIMSMRQGMRHLFFLPWVYAVLHFSYGAGFIIGMFRFLHFWLNPKYQTVPFPRKEERLDWSDAKEKKVLPFVSVIMPIRNEEKFIAQSISAILRQDYPQDRIEVIVVDGLSTDNTQSIVQRFIEMHPNVRLIENPKKSYLPL